MKKYISVVLLILCLGYLRTNAQNCTANLGNPLVNITFGAGPNFGPPLAPGITNMSYVPSTFPQDGQYSIVSNTLYGSSATWHSLSRDHTGDLNGYFMLINASYQPSDFYVQTVSGFCQGTTYQFGAWIMNMMQITTGYIEPNITFTIEKTDGTVLGSYTTGNIPVTIPAAWTQYSFYFTIPVGISTIVLRMTNNAPGGNGNDLALDDITFRPAGPAITIQNSAFAGQAGTVCTGSSFSFSSQVNNCYPSTAYQWQLSLDNGTTWANIPGGGGPNLTTSTGVAGTYLYRLEVAQSGNLGSGYCGVFSNPMTVIAQDGPVPGITITPSANPVCAGTPVTLTASTANGGSAPVYQWQVNGKDIGVTGSTYTSSTLSNNDIVTCTLTSNAPCASPATVTSNAITLSVTPIATPSVSITASANPTCPGAPVTFTAAAANGGSAPVYQWQVNGKDMGVTGSTFTSSTLSNNDIVTCTLTSNASCANPATATSNAVTMSVTSSTSPLISITASAGAICAGSPVTFTAATTGGGSAPVYQWQVNGKDIGVTGSTFTSSTFNNNDIVTCTLTSNAPCASPATATSNAVTLSVTSIAAPSVSITTSANPVCAGTPVTLTASTANGGSAPVYQWQVNGKDIGVTGSTFTSSTFSNNDIVTCTLTSNAPCASPATVTSNAITLSVTPIATPSVSITTSANPVCAGTPVTLTATTANGGSAPVYQWQVNGKDVGVTGSTLTSSAFSNNDIITCTLTSNAPCANPATVTSNAVTLSVTPIPVPSISITASVNPTCTAVPVTFAAAATGGGSAPVYQWQVNGKDIGATGSTFTSSTFSNNDIVTCILASNATCASPATAVSNTVTMTVNPLPVIAPGQVFYMYGGQPVTLNPVISGSIARFLWTPAAGLSGNTIRDPIASPPVTTLYTLEVQTTDGCMSSSIIKVEPLQKLGIPNAFTPNGDGNNDIFYVLGGPPGARVKNLAVFNRWGEQVFQVRDAVPGDRRFGWNGSYRGLPAPAGTYVYMAIVEFADATQQKFSGTVILLR